MQRETNNQRVMFRRGPKGSRAWGHWENQVTQLREPFPPAAGHKSWHDPHMINVLPLVP